MSAIEVAPLLPANAPVLRALQLPFEYAITQAGEIGAQQQLRRLERRLAQGLKLIQVREKGMQAPALERFAGAVIALARAHGARVLINSDSELAQRLGADGVHLTAMQLARTAVTGRLSTGVPPPATMPRNSRARLSSGWISRCSARCRRRRRTRMRKRWAGKALARWRGMAAMPVFALGGMRPGDLETAWRCGAQGIAMVRGSW